MIEVTKENANMRRTHSLLTDLTEAPIGSMHYVGQRVYYTGDQANCEDYGVITKMNTADQYQPHSLDILLDDGRELRRVYYAQFHAAPGRRFWIAEQWDAEQANALRRFVENARKREHFGFTDQLNEEPAKHELKSTCCPGECCKGRHI